MKHSMLGLDTEAARELELFLENDFELYRSQGRPIQDNLRRRWRKGTYDHAKAPKLWRYLVDRAALKYAETHAGGRREARHLFPGSVREHVAQRLADHWRTEMELGN